VAADGTAVCWGDDEYGQSTPPAGTFTQLSAGEYHTCGLASDGTAVCWGDDESGQSSPPAGTFTQLDAGGSTSCGLATDTGGLVCW
jgi:hypothetical protein